MKLLFISNLFPDTSEPQRGIHNARVIRALAQNCEIRVVAPRPIPVWSATSTVARTACDPDASVVPVYPVVRYLPKVGSLVNHRLYAAGIRDTMHALLNDWRPDIVLVAWLYPDGCAAARLAAEVKLPYVLIAQGSDVHQYLRMPLRRQLILPVCRQAAAVITRGRDLAEQLANAGVDANRLHTIYNGVDLDLFRPGNHSAARQELGLPVDTSIILFVGNLFAVKNPEMLLDAFTVTARQARAKPMQLIFVGDGPLRAALESKAQRRGLGKSVTFAGEQTPVNVARYMQAADLLCVPSWNEGVPNVIREAFSCGLPVVATRVGGIPELLTRPYLGTMVTAGDTAGLVTELNEWLAHPRETERIRDHSRQFSWEDTAKQYLALLQTSI